MKAATATLELRPGVGIGSIQLGMTIWDILNHLSDNNSSSNSLYAAQCSLAWDDHNPHSSAILLSLSDRISLLFDAVSQRLTAIQVEVSLIGSLSYKGKPLVPSSQVTPLRLLHLTFGPTYPPAPHPAYKDEAILSYPGVIFSFSKEYTSTSQSSNERDDSTGEQRQPIQRVIVTRHNPNNDLAPLFPDFINLSATAAFPPLANGDISHAEIILGSDATPTSISLHLISDEQDAPVPIIVQIGITTTEDLLCEFGPPNRIFYKEDSRLSIHSGHSSSGSSASKVDDTANGAFYNYFALGLDFLIHLATQRVQKIILHSNTPGEVLFGRYAKCRWVLARGDGDGSSVCSEDGAEKVKNFLNPAKDGNTLNGQGQAQAKGETSSKASRTRRPLMLDRVADSGDGLKLDRTTELCAYPGVVIEVTQNNCIETLWLV